MGREIERRFLVSGEGWRQDAPGVALRQGYLSTDPERTVRVRLAGERAWLTVKGPTVGCARAEFEWPIPATEAQQLLETLCLRPLIEKVRQRIELAGRVWEVDEFRGANAGLVLAEVELPAEDATVTLPPWVGEEVTGDPRYANASLAARPYCSWCGGTPECLRSLVGQGVAVEHGQANGVWVMDRSVVSEAPSLGGCDAVARSCPGDREGSGSRPAPREGCALGRTPANRRHWSCPRG